MAGDIWARWEIDGGLGGRYLEGVLMEEFLLSGAG